MPAEGMWTVGRGITWQWEGTRPSRSAVNGTKGSWHQLALATAHTTSLRFTSAFLLLLSFHRSRFSPSDITYILLSSRFTPPQTNQYRNTNSWPNLSLMNTLSKITSDVRSSSRFLRHKRNLYHRVRRCLRTHSWRDIRLIMSVLRRER